MILYISIILVITAALILISSNQILPKIWAQEDSLIESTAENATESTEENATERTNDDNLQQNGMISRKSR